MGSVARCSGTVVRGGAMSKGVPPSDASLRRGGGGGGYAGGFSRSTPGRAWSDELDVGEVAPVPSAAVLEAVAVRRRCLGERVV